MNIAFYAPLKPPTHTTPSGDRRMGRLLMFAWEQAGHCVQLASSFRSYDRGDECRQRRLKKIGERLADRLIRRYRARPKKQRPHIWFTYHLYHKAPDWIGPRVAKALSIPYMVAEASFAPKQAGGKWALGHEASKHALEYADVVIGFNPIDAECLAPLLKPLAHTVTTPPFMDTEQYCEIPAKAQKQDLAKHFGIDASVPWLLSVAMMRDDQKFKSYEVLARVLSKINDRSWHLLIAGTGPAEPAVKALFKGLNHRVTWLGFQKEEDLKIIYAISDLLLWPAIKEAYGMIFLEALASGLPVIAGTSPGVASIVRHDHHGLLVPQGDVDAFAQATVQLLENPKLCEKMAQQARADMNCFHSVSQMSKTLNKLLKQMQERIAA